MSGDRCLGTAATQHAIAGACDQAIDPADHRTDRRRRQVRIHAHAEHAARHAGGSHLGKRNGIGVGTLAQRTFLVVMD